MTRRRKQETARRRKAVSLRERDPFLEREQARYDNPLPSREFVLQVLEEQAAPVSDIRLFRLLDIDEREQPLMARRLAAMERDGQLIRNRRNAICVVDKMDLVGGRVQGHPDGFGFLIPEEGGADLFLSAAQMARVLHGDRVLARPGRIGPRGLREASIVEVLERVNQQLVGRYLQERGIGVVVPEERRISQDVLVPAGARRSAKPGQVVVAEIVEQPTRHAQPIGRIVEVLGDYDDPGMEIEIALRKHHLPYEFPRDVQRRAARFPDGVTDKELRGRTDVRDLPLVTIDDETARDFDDAVYCEPRGRGYRLWVAIADVSHYVKPGDALDKEARLRGNSVYFPRRVIPMLPEVLSNQLCSLNPQVDRLCMVCEMDIGAKGQIERYQFYQGVMHSHARLTYNAVAAALEHPKGKLARSLKPVMSQLKNLHALYDLLAHARKRRGAIEFETIQTRMHFDERGKIEQITPVERNVAHRIIEECMLCANVSASDFLQQRSHHLLYRIHEGPTPEKLLALRQFLGEFGLQLSGGDDPHAKDYARLLNKIRQRPDAQLLQTVMLRSLQQAVYSPDNEGHFGLAYDSYTHFTSPIRRYPDLVIHRSIKAALASKQYSPDDWHDMARHCSETERRADEATRDVESWLKSYYMLDRIGECFDGSISAVTGFGVFVALDAVYVEGLVHVSELGADYFHFDAARHQLLGERTGQRYRLGDRISVKLARVDLEQARIDFTLPDQQARPRRRRRR
ncbi:MAG: ribonuclease R [Betaproteobacteria bacterium]|nr:MAG: ribonuclease R [Betaproteobacteria bacterium]